MKTKCICNMCKRKEKVKFIGYNDGKEFYMCKTCIDIELKRAYDSAVKEMEEN